MAKRILISAGDLSGDVHSAMLVRELKRRHPDWEIWALGGSHLRAAGVEIIADSSGSGLIGIAPVLASLPRFRRMQRQVFDFVNGQPLDGAVLCDWGAFNIRLLPVLQQQNVPALYYFPPRSWRKKGPGSSSLGSLVQRVATPFPWDAERLNEAWRELPARAEWVGHPLLEIDREGTSREAVRRELGIGADGRLVAILPGSRSLELRYIAPRLAAAVRAWRATEGSNAVSPVRFVVAVPRGAASKLRAIFPEDVSILEDRAGDLLRACDAALVKSGTVTLEAAVSGAPQVVVYDGPKLMELQFRLMGGRKKVPFIAMPNIVLERAAVTELLGTDCSPERIVTELRELLENEERRARLRDDYEAVRRTLGDELPQGATVRTADMVEEMVS